MVRRLRAKYIGPRLHVAARMLCVGCALPVAWATPAAAQQGAATVDATTAARLVWSTMVALDQANTTGNYSVLRDLAAPGFQTNNSAATLAGTFQALRTQRVDVGACLILAPTFQFPPVIVQGGMLRLRGSFPLRPTAIAFDMLFANVDGQWRLFGLAVVPLVPQPAVPPTQSRSTRR